MPFYSSTLSYNPSTWLLTIAVIFFVLGGAPAYSMAGCVAKILATYSTNGQLTADRSIAPNEELKFDAGSEFKIFVYPGCGSYPYDYSVVTPTGTVTSAVQKSTSYWTFQFAASGSWEVRVDNSAPFKFRTLSLTSSLPAQPRLISISPSQLVPGESQRLVVRGENLSASLWMAFSKPEISVDATRFIDATAIEVYVRVRGDAAPGNVSITAISPSATSNGLELSIVASRPLDFNLVRVLQAHAQDPGPQATDYRISQGQRVCFAPKKEDRWYAGGAWIGPEGLGKAPADSPMPTAPAASLVAQIGEGRPFFVGSGTCITAESSGPLWLYINDSPLASRNRMGSIRVEVAPGLDLTPESLSPRSFISCGSRIPIPFRVKGAAFSAGNTAQRATFTVSAPEGASFRAVEPIRNFTEDLAEVLLEDIFVEFASERLHLKTATKLVEIGATLLAVASRHRNERLTTFSVSCNGSCVAVDLGFILHIEYDKGFAPTELVLPVLVEYTTAQGTSVSRVLQSSITGRCEVR